MRDPTDPTSPPEVPAQSRPNDSPRTVDAVLGDAVTVLRAFGTDDTHLTVEELVGRTGLPFGVVAELAQALVTSRLFEPTGISYRLSTLLFELGMRASAERGLIEVATPFLEDLYERTRETVHLGVREQLDVVYISKIGGHGFTEVPSRIGERLPLHCTAIGKVMLANADEASFDAVVKRGLTPAGPRTITVPAVLHAQLQTIADPDQSGRREGDRRGQHCGPDVSLQSGAAPRIRAGRHGRDQHVVRPSGGCADRPCVTTSGGSIVCRAGLFAPVRGVASLIGCCSPWSGTSAHSTRCGNR